MALTSSLAQKLSRDFSFYGFAAEQNLSERFIGSGNF